MKKSIKVLFIILLMLALCGCTIKEDVTMDVHGKVKESVVIDVDTDNKSEEELNEYISLVLIPYNSALNLRKYTSKINYDENTSKIIFSNDYDNICTYVEKTVFSQYVYHHVSCTQTDEYIEIKNESDHIDYCPDCTSEPALDDVSYTINLPIAADESTADVVDGNSYTWKFNSNTPKDKKFYIKINKSLLNESLKKQEAKNKIKGIFHNIGYVLIGIGIVVVIIQIFRHYKKIYINHNKMEY